MSLSILNNIAALYAQNNLNSTQSNLQNTLQQLSSGSRINSGADDASGLAVADGLHANEAALTQSAQNASSGIGLLQTADGSLSQVTNLLDRAVTLATEAANGTLTSAQVSSANQEYQNILAQIGNIGSTSNFNSSAVFTSSATNIVVTDGTSGGLNVYADTVGKLATSSVGTTAGAVIVTKNLTPVTMQPANAVKKVAGQYTLTPNAATDTFSGQLSVTVGSGKELDITVAAGTTLSALQSQLSGDSDFTGLGLSAALNKTGTALVITGPTSGATTAANTVSFTGTSLTDSVTISGASQITGSVGTAASTGTAATGSLTFAGAQSGDEFSGDITLTQGSKTLTVTIDPNSKSGDAATSGTIQYQIAQAIAGQSDFGVAAQTGTSDNPVLNFTGPMDATAGGITITNSLADATTSSGVTYDAAGVAGTAVAAGTYSLSPMSSSADTYGAGSTITIAGEDVKLDGLTGTQAAAAITADTTLTAAGISAAYDTTSNVLTITGKSDGTAFDVSGVSSLTDSGATSSTASTGTAATGSITVAKSADANDTFAGTIILTQGELTKTVTIAADSKMGDASDATTVQGQITAALKNSGFSLAADGGTATDPVLNFTGAKDATSDGVTITGTFKNTTASTDGTVTDNTGVAGTAPTKSTYVLSAMGSSTDTYGAGSKLTIAGEDVSLDGLSGTDAAAAITADTALTAAGISAAYDTTTNLLTISGKSDGSSFTVAGLSSLSDVSATPTVVTAPSTTKAAAGHDAVAAGTAVITLANLGDTLSGTVSVEIAGNAAKTGSLTIKAGTTGSGLATQINNDSSFKTAGITAAYDSTVGTITLTGPAGIANQLTVSGTITDSTVSTPGAGADFTASSVSSLTADTASTVLTTVTSAIADVAYQRGTIGADINQLTSSSNVASAESVNLTSAEQSIRATNYGQAASDLSKYQILSQAGISALAQANSVQQEVLKLLQ